MLNFNEMVEQSGLAEYFYELGYLEGLRECKRDGMREIIQLALTGRFSVVPGDVRESVARAGEKDLHALVPLLVGGSLEQIRRFLKLD